MGSPALDARARACRSWRIRPLGAGRAAAQPPARRDRAQRLGATPAQLALAWLLRAPDVIAIPRIVERRARARESRRGRSRARRCDARTRSTPRFRRPAERRRSRSCDGAEVGDAGIRRGPRCRVHDALHVGRTTEKPHRNSGMMSPLEHGDDAWHGWCLIAGETRSRPRNIIRGDRRELHLLRLSRPRAGRQHRAHRDRVCAASRALRIWRRRTPARI